MPSAPPLMQYRESSSGLGGYGARGSPYPTVPSNEPPDADPNDDGGPPGYSHDRIQNDLLDEICSDIGIKDAMDLDFLDFDTGPGGEAPYIFTGVQGSSGSDFDLADMTEGFINRTSATDNEKLAVAGMTRVLDSPPPVLPIAAPPSVKNEKVDSPTVSSSSSEDAPKYNTSSSGGPLSAGPGSGPPPAPHGSPHVHSTTTTIEITPSSVDASEPCGGCLKSEPDSGSGGGGGRSSSTSSSSTSSSCPSAAVPPAGTTQRPTSVDSSNGSVPPASPSHHHHHHHRLAASTDNLKATTSMCSSTPGTLSKTSGFTASLKSELYTSFSQPASPAKSAYHHAGNMGGGKMHSYSHDNLPHAARSLTGHAAFHMPPAAHHTQQGSQQQEDGFKVPQGPPISAAAGSRLMKENLPPSHGGSRSVDSPCDGSYYSMGSPSFAPAMKSSSTSDSNNVVAELKLESLPTTADLSIPAIQQDGCSSGASSQPDSPSAMHVAKRARTINNGSDLLEEMRERYSYVKGASIYDPPTRPPSQMHSPSHTGPAGPGQFGFPSSGGQADSSSQSQQQQQHTYQGNPPAGPGAGAGAGGAGSCYGYSRSSCNRQQAMPQQQQQQQQQQQAGLPPTHMGMYGQQQQAQGGWYPNNGNSSNSIPPQQLQSSHNRSQYMDGGSGGVSATGGYPPQSAPSAGPLPPIGMVPPPHMPPQHMGGGGGGHHPGHPAPHMQGSPHPSMHHPSQQLPPPHMGPGGGGGYMNQTSSRPPDMLNSAQTFSVNQPLGSALPPHHQPLLPSDPSKPMTAQQGLMHSIINDGSSAFRSHPLFPLLRDLIIADLNFHTPSFPFQLIANLPAEFDKLLMNYQNRNPPNRAFAGNPAVEGVIMDALRYAHQSLIEKIQVKKREVGYQDTAKPLTAIEDFCERFDRAVKNTMTPEPGGPPPVCGGPGGAGMYGGPVRTSASLPSTPSKHSGSSSRPPAATDSSGSSGSTDSKPKATATAGRNKVLPKEAVSTMLEWLKEHQDNPYPNDDEKEMLINKTKLTINQINYWFTNARRRILPKWALQRYMDQQKLQQQQHHHQPGPPQQPPGPYRGMATS